LAGAGTLTASKPLLAEGEVSRPALKAKLKHHLERAQDASEFLDYLDQLEAKSEPSAAPSSSTVAPDPDPFRTGAPGRPGAYHFVQDELKRRISTREVVPTPNGLAAASRDLEQWWEQRRQTFNPLGPPMKALSIENSVREIWNAALNANPIK
jgi:hypothetical protein